ncbi:hypothetical protein F3J34_09455 [Klebsiella sp. Ap-873]|uniref:Fimbrial protein n=1 Tax=Cedecea neteri TaxID=158822 RepID=A0AAN0VUG6_9ENTR|nr:hypothetical protein [Cedecea neteri]AIR61946.1 hypothetical protein LH23_15195 [Cedecea neteri]NIG73822.1 hypothetical protein [Klebsiella sp. Ap-873]
MLNKSLIALGTLGLVFAGNTSAVTFDDNLRIERQAKVIVTQDSQVTIRAFNINNRLPENGDELKDTKFFQLGISSLDTNVKVSLAGGGETLIQGDGTVYSAPRQEDGTTLIGIVENKYLGDIETDPLYLPNAANKTTGASAVLLSGGTEHYLTINGADVSQNIMPGQYTFNFVAQAYTE